MVLKARRHSLNSFSVPVSKTATMGSDVYYPSEPPFGPVLNGTQVIVFYHYRPNKPAGFAFLALFAIATLAHLLYLFRLRAWFFIPLILGGIGASPSAPFTTYT